MNGDRYYQYCVCGSRLHVDNLSACEKAECKDAPEMCGPCLARHQRAFHPVVKRGRPARSLPNCLNVGTA